jgi:hypothetical protein
VPNASDGGWRERDDGNPAVSQDGARGLLDLLRRPSYPVVARIVSRFEVIPNEKPLESSRACASFTWVISGSGAVRLCPEAVPHFAAADIESTQRRYRRRTILYPTHPRTFQTFADDLATRFRRATPYVPAPSPIARIIRAMAIVLKVTEQLPQLLDDLRRCFHRQGDLPSEG